MIYYPVPVHRLPVYDLPVGTCPAAEAVAADVLSLPIWPTLDAERQKRIISTLRAAL
jgi:dTDP-4-amino-4,6-dideoxygalactose transaminase